MFALPRPLADAGYLGAMRPGPVGWESAVFKMGEVWTGHGPTQAAALEAALRRMFPSTIAWSLAVDAGLVAEALALAGAPALPRQTPKTLQERLAAVGVRRR